jgi:hypothetical protein
MVVISKEDILRITDRRGAILQIIGRRREDIKEAIHQTQVGVQMDFHRIKLALVCKVECLKVGCPKAGCPLLLRKPSWTARKKIRKCVPENA